MAEQVATDSSIVSLKPFVYRVGLPYLVGKLFPNAITLGFKLINLLLGVFTLAILFYLFGDYIKDRLIVYFLLMLYIVNPYSAFRATFFYPVFTDTAAFFFILLIFLVNKKLEGILKYIVLNILIFCGIFFREIVFVMPVVISIIYLRKVYGQETKFTGLKIQDIGHLSPVFVGIMAIVITHLIVTPTGQYTFFSHALAMLNRNLHQPEILLLSFFTAFGPILFVILATLHTKEISSFLHKNQDILVYFFCILFLSTIGGNHIDRFIFWIFPATLIVIGYVFEQNLLNISSLKLKIAFFIPIIIGQFFAFRILGEIPNTNFDALANPGKPEFIFFGPYGKDTNFAHIFASMMLRESRFILLIQYSLLMLYLSLILIMSKRSCKQSFIKS